MGARLLSIIVFALYACLSLGQSKIVLTIDDFGATPFIDSAVADIVDQGLVTNIEVMPNFKDGLPRLQSLYQKHPDLTIGVHLTISSGASFLPADSIPTLIDEDGQFYALRDLLHRMDKIDLTELEKELEAQIMAVQSLGILVHHFSSQHNILSLYAPFFDVVLKLAQKYDAGLRAVTPISLIDRKNYGYCGALKLGKSIAKKYFFKHPFHALRNWSNISPGGRKRSAQKVEDMGIAHPDHLCVNVFYKPTLENMKHIVEHLPIGTTEIVFHPGYAAYGDLPKGMENDYFPFREKEAALLLSTEFKNLMKEYNLVPYPSH